MFIKYFKIFVRFVPDLIIYKHTYPTPGYSSLVIRYKVITFYMIKVINRSIKPSLLYHE